jgi:hypothetical protein
MPGVPMEGWWVLEVLEELGVGLVYCSMAASVVSGNLLGATHTTASYLLCPSSKSRTVVKHIWKARLCGGVLPCDNSVTPSSE